MKLNNPIRRVCEVFTKGLPVWTVALSLACYYYPSILTTWISKNFINWFFCLTMFGIGLTLKLEGFLPILNKPWWVLLGNAAQFTVMPALGFIVGRWFNKDLSVGFVIVGTVPGAMASNVISYVAKADVPYSVFMTTTATLVAPIVTPSLIKLLVGSSVHVPFWNMAWQVLWMTVIPIILGIAIRKWGKNWTDTLEPVAGALATLAIVIICSYIIAVNKAILANLTIWVLLGVIFVNIWGYILGYLVGYWARFDKKRRRTLSFEVGMQNSGLGVILAINNFAPISALPCALFAIWCIISASFMANIWAKTAEERTLHH